MLVAILVVKMNIEHVQIKDFGDGAMVVDMNIKQIKHITILKKRSVANVGSEFGCGNEY